MKCGDIAMSQMTFAEAEYNSKKRKTRREQFLERIETLIPWAKLEQKLVKNYPRGANGRPPYPLSTMLRVHCLQLFYNLSDPAMEDALYEIDSMRRFAGLRLSDRLPDETTILNFRHFLEKHDLGKAIFDTMNEHLAAHGLVLREGSIVDATILSAPSSTKNKAKARDPEMHQTRKGQQWYFGMKMHIGVDDALGLIHSVETTSAEVHDIAVADKLLHGKEKRFLGDAGYTGIAKREEHKNRKINWMVAMRPGLRAQLPENSLLAIAEKSKASVRAKVEHSFFYIKRMFGYGKVRYRGLAKNNNRLHVLAAFSNLMMARKYLPT
jgi:transposase, IS5 family